MYTIAKRFSFDAAHHLPHLPDGHKCKRPHGHTYSVEVVLQAAILNEYGFVVDYGDLSEFKRYIDDTLDHQDLNEVLPFPTTAENIAHYLYHYCKYKWPQVVAVRVSETPNTYAEYRETQSKPNRHSH